MGARGLHSSVTLARKGKYTCSAQGGSERPLACKGLVLHQGHGVVGATRTPKMKAEVSPQPDYPNRKAIQERQRSPETCPDHV